MDQTSEAELENALGNINSGSDGLKNTYERTLERIRAQPSKKRELANRILGWLTHSYKALTISELREALAIEPGTIELDQRARPRLQMLDSVCAGLINIDQSTGVVQLAHKTVKEYFDKTSRFPEAHRTITEACLTYLSYDEFSSGMCLTEKSLIERLRDYPLYDYAAKHWASHASVSQCESEIILSLLRHDQKTSACKQASLYYGSPIHDTSKSRGVHLAARHGLQNVMSTLIKEGQSAESRDHLNKTPLLYAAEYGRTHLAKILLRTYKVDPNFTNTTKETALSLVAYHGNVEFVRTLLEVDQTDPNIPDWMEWTPLMQAASIGSLGVVEELLRDSRTNINRSSKNGETALHIAARNGHEHICLRLLKQDGIDLTVNKHGDSPLHQTASLGLSTIVQQLLKKDSIDINKRDSSGRTPLIRVLNGQLSTIRATETTKVLLGDHRIELNATDKFGKPALMIAIHGGFIEAARLILAQDKVDVNAKDNWGETAVMWAAEHGEADLIHALACHGVHFDVVNKKGKSALHYAVDGYRSKHVKGDDEQFRTVNELLDKYGLEADREDATGRAPISYAAEGGSFSITELLISKYKVDISRKDHVERTPFSYAAERGHESILRLLLEAGFTGIDLQDIKGRSPLSYAAELEDWGWENISKFILYLLSLGADINSKDGQGNTPLFYAVRQTNLENTKVLLEKGALITREVMQMARYNKHIVDSKSREVYKLVKEKELAQRS
jgi:ankyrin repeat protein